MGSLNRVSRDLTWLKVACALSEQSTCLRRAVGCVLLDANGEVGGTGWNGVASKRPHCNEGHPCGGADLPESEHCVALHAEWNALGQCADKWALRTAYSTYRPCLVCVKLLLNTGVRRIVFLDAPPGPSIEKHLWLSGGDGREWIHFTESGNSWLPT